MPLRRGFEVEIKRLCNKDKDIFYSVIKGMENSANCKDFYSVRLFCLAK